ncbi:MAG TPA: prepilin peptidase [Stellaceae bacterium]|nr:prepilin peptidase [Stellaceae bacterium]
MIAGHAAETALLFAYGGLLAVAVVTDVAALQIPDFVPLALALLFVPAALLSPAPVDWLSHVAAAAISLVVGIGLFAWGKLGGGDVKLIAAVALWHGLKLLPALVLSIGIAGGIAAILCVLLRWAGLGRCLAARGTDLVALRAGADIPYAVAIAGAAGLLLLMPR